MSTNLEISARPAVPIIDRSHHWLVAASSVMWLLVAAASVYGGLGDDDGWEAAYTVLVLTLTIAASVTAFTVVRRSQPAARAVMWPIGVAVLVVAVLTTLVAWATVFWQASLAVGFVTLAVGTGRPRTPLLALAGAQLAGLAAFVVGNALEIGDVDSYGDHPVAGYVSVVVSSFLTAAVVWLTIRTSGERTDR
jgi:hypothetical protein